MLDVSVAHYGRRAAMLVGLLVAVPCVAQTPVTPAAATARPSQDDIAAFARISVEISKLRDSAQARLAQPANNKPEAQKELRDRLVAQIADVLRRASMSEAEFRRKNYLVSTDSAARRVYDETFAKLTGAPLPGQVQTAAAAPAVKVPAGPVGVHIGHVVNAFADTPMGQGLLPTAMAEARIAVQHAGLAARNPANLDAMKLHAGHVINAVDPTVIDKGPGLGYGVKKAAEGIATHIELAAKVSGASKNVVMHSQHVAAAARNSVQRADQIVALAKQIQAATSATEAAALVSQLVSLTNELVAGKDVNADGRVGLEQGEGGLQQCDEHVKLLLAGEGGA
ncbi:MAG TPA: hypothetical protein VLN49_08000 [Gemmatimonadaceae bacterium]|nr:hypothetical protein [Gemmatimonadaceae bacterium]